jgi:cytosine/adenosine deaminase-related metal-dependent hydrolase
MTPVNLVVWGSRLVTDPASLPGKGLIERGAVAVGDDRVVEVGRYDELLARYPDAETLGSESSLVFPGLVNTHHHGWGLSNYQMGAADEYLELLALGDLEPQAGRRVSRLPVGRYA